MISTFIRNACGAVWNIVLLSTVDALDLLPSYEEVNNVLYCYKCWYRNGKACHHAAPPDSDSYGKTAGKLM